MITQLIAFRTLIGVAAVGSTTGMYAPTLLPQALIHQQHLEVARTVETDEAEPEAPAEVAVQAPPADVVTAPPADVVTAPPVQDTVVINPDNPAHALLGTLQHNADGLTAFTANVHYVTENDLLGEKIIRKGRLVYQVPGDAGRRFAILFDSLVVDGRKRERKKHYVFSGRYLVEIDHADKLFIKREIAAPGEEFDPFRLGEGPIPLPIGQARGDVLRLFEASIVALPESGPLDRLIAEDVDGVRLVPRPGTSAEEEYQRIDLFYDRATQLPVGIDLVEINGDRKTVRLDAIQRNPALAAADLDVLRIDEPDPRQWHIDIRPLR